jgi:hypothetical protein
MRLSPVSLELDRPAGLQVLNWGVPISFGALPQPRYCDGSAVPYIAGTDLNQMHSIRVMAVLCETPAYRWSCNNP